MSVRSAAQFQDSGQKLLKTTVSVFGRFLLRPDEEFNAVVARQLIDKSKRGHVKVSTELRVFTAGIQLGGSGIFATMPTEFIKYHRMADLVVLVSEPATMAVCVKDYDQKNVILIRFKDGVSASVVADMVRKYCVLYMEQLARTTEQRASIYRTQTGASADRASRIGTAGQSNGGYIGQTFGVGQVAQTDGGYRIDRDQVDLNGGSHHNGRDQVDQGGGNHPEENSHDRAAISDAGDDNAVVRKRQIGVPTQQSALHLTPPQQSALHPVPTQQQSASLAVPTQQQSALHPPPIQQSAPHSTPTKQQSASYQTPSQRQTASYQEPLQQQSALHPGQYQQQTASQLALRKQQSASHPVPHLLQTASYLTPNHQQNALHPAAQKQQSSPYLAPRQQQSASYPAPHQQLTVSHPSEAADEQGPRLRRTQILERTSRRKSVAFVTDSVVDWPQNLRDGDMAISSNMEQFRFDHSHNHTSNQPAFRSARSSHPVLH